MSASCCDHDEKPKAPATTKDHTDHDHDHKGHAHGHDTHKGHNHDEGHNDHDDDHADHDHDHGDPSSFRTYVPAITSLLLLLMGIGFDHFFKSSFFTGWVRFVWYALSYMPVGWPVIKETLEGFKSKQFFTEFSLMALAMLGAFSIGEYPEGVAVMLFYAVGELFQSAAVNRAKGNIKALLDVRPHTAAVLREGTYQTVAPESVDIGETIQIRSGEKAPLDGEMLSNGSSFNTSALTGESKPKNINQGETVLAGMVNLDKVIELKVSRKFADSSLARILDLVQNASSRKAKTELMIRRFAQVYTPIVFFLAMALVVLPYVIVEHYVFREWLYRALVFLVISCPCALVISIPLGYFGGIGAASRNGILFKGGNYLDVMAKVNTVVMDKTGTLTEGVFEVQDVQTTGMDKTEFMRTLIALEQKSTHPIAKAVTQFVIDNPQALEATDVEEISGHGLKGTVNGATVLAGNTKLLRKFDIAYDATIDSIVETIVVVAINGAYTGHVTIADQIKTDAQAAVKAMHDNGVNQTIMLSGDKSAITQKVAQSIGIDTAYGDLLPEDKVAHVEKIKTDPSKVVAFVGDGVNDAPVLALSDVGIAMGGMGSDAAIETADVVIQTDQPSKIATAIKISKATKHIVWQNIGLAFSVKAIVLLLGAGGLATMWEAVFADVGVALLAILNAMRIQRMTFD
ncbi:Zinc-transporting ATPase [Ephemeroptericola cinctiostellae]|uniref:P-type Zn(2+) transporter n=1 Tax=Ephemeroptericola cinctiostellae TaxID=2268024 RepID=A0A345DDQ4_9BURK|nr:heavy metal translocating P-type ATPase [Ephemeroptericola cinctiostellae]AXF86492.1 Zinc-transporting ATPase [Ephemeroptericola cinctiostellae]